MSVLLQIERELTACNQARFEKIVGLFLKARGVAGVSLLGSVEGKDKTRTGIPDIYASKDGRSFTFFACTTITGASAVKTKLLGDIDECIDPQKTGVELDAIDKLLLAFNSNLKPSTLQEIASYGLSMGVEVEFLSLSDIALDLQRQYGWIAADELGVALDTGQLLPIGAFVNAYDHGKLATPLDTEFRFREALVLEGMQALTTPGSVLIIGGAAGTGKTRLALEIARRAKEQEPKCHVLCVYNKDIPLFDDLNRYFSPPGNYLVLVDDANRVNGRTHILDFAKQSDEAHTYRFILTVRDYAEGEVARDAKLLGACFSRLGVGALSRQELYEYLEKEFGIANDLYKAQIWTLSQGNARLATMAAKEAVKTNSLNAIHDVTDLYELYFSDITEALKEPGNTSLKTLGILSVLRHVRQRDEETATRLLKAFGITKQDFWIAIDRLHDLEFVDLHGHEVAKVSDQVLATFCFYLCFVKHIALPFENLIKHFADFALERVQDAVYGACNTMNVEAVRKVIDAPIVAAIKQSPPGQQLQFLKPFWFVDTSLTLRIVCDLISVLPDNLASNDFNWDEKASYSDDLILSVLARFRHASEVDVSAAIDLVLLYFTRRPEQAGKILKLITEASGFGFDRYSNRVRYSIQRLVTERVTAVAGLSAAHATLFMGLAKSFLAVEFDSHYSEDHHTVTFCHFGLENCSEITHIRHTLWTALKDSFRAGIHADAVCMTLLDYARQHSRDSATEILQGDTQELQEWAELLDSSNYLHCVIIHALRRRFHWSGINLFEAEMQRFNCPAFMLRKLISMSFQEEDDSDFDYHAFERIKADRMLERYGSISEADLPDFISLCQEISNGKDGRNDDYEVRSSVVCLFEAIGNSDPKRLAQLTNVYLSLGDPLGFGGWSWVPALVRGIGKHATRVIIEAHQFARQQEWLLSVYTSLGESEIEKEDVEQILCLLETPVLVLPHIGTLKSYGKHEPKILPKVVALVLATRGDQAGRVLHSLLGYPRAELEWVRSQFDDDIEILKSAYLVTQGDGRRNSGYFDHDASLFSLILDLAPDFITEYVQYRFAGQKWLSEHDENYRNYECLWSRGDWPSLLLALVDAITSARDDGLGNYLAAWFPLSGAHLRTTLSDSGEDAVHYVIRNRANSRAAMRIVFLALCAIDSQQRLTAFREFLSVNKSLEDFTELPLWPTIISSTNGSFLTQYRARIRFIEQLHEFMPGVELIGHRAFLNEEIRNIQAQISWEEEREFIDPNY